MSRPANSASIPLGLLLVLVLIGALVGWLGFRWAPGERRIELSAEVAPSAADREWTRRRLAELLGSEFTVRSIEPDRLELSWAAIPGPANLSRTVSRIPAWLEQTWSERNGARSETKRRLAETRAAIEEEASHLVHCTRRIEEAPYHALVERRNALLVDLDRAERDLEELTRRKEALEELLMTAQDETPPTLTRFGSEPEPGREPEPPPTEGERERPAPSGRGRLVVFLRTALLEVATDLTARTAAVRHLRTRIDGLENELSGASDTLEAHRQERIRSELRLDDARSEAASLREALARQEGLPAESPRWTVPERIDTGLGSLTATLLGAMAGLLLGVVTTPLLGRSGDPS